MDHTCTMKLNGNMTEKKADVRLCFNVPFPAPDQEKPLVLID